MKTLMLIVLAALVGTARAAPGEPRPASEIAALLAGAEPGATVRVPPGVYRGPLAIDRPVRLEGGGRVTIDGGGQGDVVVITAGGVEMRGFTIRGTGHQLYQENAAVRVTGGPVVIEDNVLEDVLFGIDLHSSPGSVIRGNTISSKPLDLGVRGDAIRLWWSADAVVEDNHVRGARDVIVWYSERVAVRRNTVEDGRYGLHSMYSKHLTMEENVLRDNSVGVYLMYSKDVVIRRNTLAGNRGPSGYGLGLKDSDDVLCEDNLIAKNRAGIFVDNTPFTIGTYGRFTRNVIAFNDIGVSMAPSARRNEVWSNAFLENEEQVAVLGRGNLEQNAFSLGGVGNFWSDYPGYDLDADGVGDLPYRAASLFEDLMGREPKLRLFVNGPAQQAVDLAARALPSVRPEPKFEDPAPLMAPPPTGAPTPERVAPWPLVAIAAALLAACGGLAALSFARSGLPARPALNA